MSRIGKLPIKVPDKVNITINSTSITVKGPKGELSKNLPTSIKIIQNDKSISVLPNEGLNDSYQLYGTYRSLVNNMITGVTDGFQRKLELQGVGYRSQIEGKTLILNVGYSHQVKILSPEGIKLSVEGNTNVTVSGLDKELVGQIAANIRLVRPPEPYKGKGIRYQGEYVRKKVGKAGKK
jgi:large subunit ribosomal protein L6